MTNFACGCAIGSHRTTMLELLDAIDFARLAPERQSIIAVLKHNVNLPHCCGELLKNDTWETALRSNEYHEIETVAKIEEFDPLDELLLHAEKRPLPDLSGRQKRQHAFVRFVPSPSNNQFDRFELLENNHTRMHPVSYDPFATTHKVTPDDISAVFSYLVYRDGGKITSRNINRASAALPPQEMMWFRSMHHCAAVQLAVEILDSTWTGDVSEWPLGRIWQTVQTGIRQDIFWVNDVTKRVEPIATREPSSEDSSFYKQPMMMIASPLSIVSASDPMYEMYKWYYTFGYFYYNFRDRLQQQVLHNFSSKARKAYIRGQCAKRMIALVLRNCSPMPLRQIAKSLSEILLSKPRASWDDARFFQVHFGCKNVFEFVRLCGDVVRLEGKHSISVVYNCEPDLIPLPDSAYSRSDFLFNLTYRGTEASIPRLPW